MGKEAEHHSCERQRQLAYDRQRTRAISAYLADNREKLLLQLKDADLQDKNRKRKALERIAREHFGRESELVQRSCFQKVSQVQEASTPARKHIHKAKPSSPKKLRRSGRSGAVVSGSEGVAAGARVVVSASQGAAAGTQVVSQVVSQGVPAGDNTLREGLVNIFPHLRSLCGDAGAAEALAQGLRILDVMELIVASWPLLAPLKLAILAGVSVKLSQTQQPGAVQSLWKKLAGKAALKQIREWEPRLLNGWASKSLGAEYRM